MRSSIDEAAGLTEVAIARRLPNQCRDVDQPTAAIIKDLKQRGLLDDTLVIFATEFGRTVFSQGRLGDPGMGREAHVVKGILA